MVEERWLWVPGHEGRYEISDHGRVRSWIPSSYKRQIPYYLKPSPINGGYLRFQLFCKSKAEIFLVHRLVMMAFVGPSDLQVNHLNGIKTDNRLSNLEYVTASENALHSFAVLGRRTKPLRGEECLNAKLTYAKVAEIRHLLDRGVSQRQIARQYGVAQARISLIKQGKAWAQELLDAREDEEWIRGGC